MAVHFFLHSVLSLLYVIAIYYTAEKIIEKLQEEIRDDALQEINKYVAAQSGDYLVASIGRPLGYLLSIAGLSIAKEIAKYLVEKFKGYAVEKIKKYVVAPVRENVVAPIGFQLNYLLCYRSNIEGFRTQFENLKKTRDDVQGRVDAAERKDEVILQNVREWLTNVDKVIVESRNIFEDELQLKLKNLKFYHQLILKLCYQLNLKSYYQRSRYAKEKTAEVDKLCTMQLRLDGGQVASQQERNSFNRVSTNELAFESRKSIFEKIMEAVKNEKINIIGIYGMGGVGKTTLVKEVGKRAKDSKLFDEIVMAVVSQSPDLKRVQGEIADMLCLKFDQETESGRARRLSARLEETKRILVILDDVWERVELEAIGIPFGGKHRGCKILLTSRSLDVCNRMEAEKNFSLKVLSEQEGWNLFRTMAGETVDFPDLHDVAVDIAKECAGLPIAIVTVARALKKKKNFYVWSNALNKLRMSNPEKMVFSTLELSYNYLDDEEAQKIFLLCCLFPEDYDIPIRFLMMYGIGLRLFKDVNTVDEARARAHALAHSLKSSCLLQDSEKEECVKMHDVIRDVAIKIASGDEHGFLVRAGVGRKELPEEYASKRYTYSTISLWSDDIHKLPVELECPKLQILLLGRTGSSLQSHNNLSLMMESLRVLSIFSINFLSLPPSLGCLKNLRTLCLTECNLKDISIIGELKNLEILSFLESDIEELPKEIGMLTQLRLLDLKGCKNLTVINLWKDPAQHACLHNLTVVEVEDCGRLKNLFSLSLANELSKLVELTVRRCEIMEEIFGNENETASAAAVDDIVFPHLRSLKLEDLPNLRNFCTKMKGNLDTHTRQPLFDKKVSFPQLKVLNVKGCHKMSKVVQFNLLLSLEELTVQECDSLEEVVEVEGLVVETLNQLKELKLWEVWKLKHIMQCDKYPHRILGFRNLSSIVIYQCNNLKSLFSSSMTNCLAQLKEVKITLCKMMESIITEERKGKENWTKIVFPQLRTLELLYLPKLISFMQTIQQKLSIEDEIVKEVPQEGNLPDPIQPLFDEKVAFTNLVELRIVNIENLQEIFHTQLADESFSQLRFLEVTNCHKLSRVAPSNLLPRLQNLEKLIVEECISMEKIFELEGEGHSPISLSQLEYVKLRYSRSLLMFCSGKYDFELPSLETFRFSECRKMQTFSYGLKGTPKLKTVEVEQFKEVWKGDLNSTIHHLFQEGEIKERLYWIKHLVYGLHSRDQGSNVQEDEDKDQDEEVGEKSEVANTKEQEREENMSTKEIHHEIQEAAEVGHQKGLLEGELAEDEKFCRWECNCPHKTKSSLVVREHLKVGTNLLDGLVFHEPELGVEEDEEEEESEKSGQANIEELQEIFVHSIRVIKIVDKDGLRKQKRVVVIREHLKRMMDLVDRLGLRERELSIRL